MGPASPLRYRVVGESSDLAVQHVRKVARHHWRVENRRKNSRNEENLYYPYCRYNGTSQLTNRFDQTTQPADMEHVMITGMNKEKTSKGMILGAYGRMIDNAVEIT